MPDTPLVRVKRGPGPWVTEPESSGGGGSSNLLRIEAGLDASTPGLVSGVSVYSPNDGDFVLSAWWDYDVLFDGTTPQLSISCVGTPPLLGPPYGFTGGTIAALDSFPGATSPGNGARYVGGSNIAVLLDGSLDVVAVIDDGLGGDAGATVGSGTLILFVAAAS